MSTLNKPLNDQQATPGINRREFLYYLSGGSLALFTATICGVVYHFTARTLPLELQEGVFEVELDILPNALEPVAYVEARAWLTPSKNGLLALNAWCPTRQEAIPKWVDFNNRFECPVCGAKFQLDGTYISGPSPRNMDQFVLHVRTPNGTVQTPPEGGPVSIENATQIFVDTNRVILGAPRPR